MAVFCIEKTRDYMVMSNHHLCNVGMSLKSQGLLFMILSFSEGWNYTTRGLAKNLQGGNGQHRLNPEGVETGWLNIVRNHLRDSKGEIVDVEYIVYKTLHCLDTDWLREVEYDTACSDMENFFKVRLVKKNATSENIVCGNAGAASEIRTYGLLRKCVKMQDIPFAVYRNYRSCWEYAGFLNTALCHNAVSSQQGCPPNKD